MKKLNNISLKSNLIQKQELIINRICKKCNKIKLLSDFVKSKNCKFGRTHTCYECNNLELRKIYPKRKLNIKKSRQKYRKSEKGKLKRIEYQKIFKENNPSYYPRYNKELHSLERSICIWHYSNGSYQCSCCHLMDGKIFLQIDHIDNNAKKEESTQLARLLIKRNLPKGFQILCGSCNHAKFRNGGICPHKTMENEKID